MNPLDDRNRLTEDARAKMQSIAAVPIRQSALDKAKAEAKAKKLRDEREAASALEDFVKEFDADISDDREWQTGGVEGGMKHSSNHGAGARVSMGAGSRRHFTGAREEEFMPRTGKKRNLDSFLEEIKRDHAVRDSRGKYNRGESSFSEERASQYDPAKTLNVACLPLSTSQSQLRELLSQYGEIVHIKVVTERPTSKDFSRRSASATVVFETSHQAEKAHTAIDGRYMGEGWRIIASWGDREQTKIKDVPSAPFNASVPSQALSKSQLSRAPPPSSLLVPANVPKWGQTQQLTVKVQRPRDARAVRRIHAVIEGVTDYGPDFEALLMEREKYNEDYAFLFDSNLPDAQYYRWKSYSLKNGDTPYSWRTEPFQMFEGGEWWIPPEQVNVDEDDVRSDPGEEEERQATRVKGFLGQSGQKKFLWLLRGVDNRRGSVARGMAYAMDRSDAAEEIVDIIIASLCSDETPLPKKIARLYLVSDILHNSSSGRSNVWKYRQLFEARMASVFSHLHTIYTSFDGRIKADNFRRQIMAITSVWETWMVFNNSNVDAWIKTFLGRVEAEERTNEVPVEEVVEKPVERKSKWKSLVETSGKEAEVVPMSGFTDNPLNSPEGDEEEDVDGEEMEEDADGMPVEEEDVDGEPMEEEDVDGEPMEDEDDDSDIDGVPMDEPHPPEESAPLIALPHRSPEPPVEQSTNKESSRPQKRQRMRAADMFMDS